MKPIIFDVGSYSLRVGYSGEYTPRFDIPLVVGSIRSDIDFMTKKRIFDRLGIKKFKQEYFFGHEALYLQNYLDFQWVVDGKTILDEFFFDKIIDYASELLKKPLTNQSILYTMPFHSEMGTHFGTKLFSLHKVMEVIPTFQPLLTAMATGLHTGLLIDIGHFLTQITPIVNGMVLVDGVQVIDIGGKDITEVLVSLLKERGAFEELSDSVVLSPWAIAEVIKQTYCYVSRDPGEELDDPKRRGSEIRFPLLGTELLHIGLERMLAPEILFAPQKANIPPLDEIIINLVNSYEGAIQQALLGNILLTGGTSLLPGLTERLSDELTRKYIDYDYKVTIHPFAQYGNPGYSAFFGAAKLASIELPPSMKISKVDFEYAGSLNLPITMLEEFASLLEQTKNISLKTTIISVKNLHDRRLFQELYNIINSQRVTSIRELGARLERSPLELYQKIEVLLSYDIIQGDFEGYNFVNSQYRDEAEEQPYVSPILSSATPQETQPVASSSPPAPSSQPKVAEEEDYVPTFQRLDSQIPDQGPSQVEAQKRHPVEDAEAYVPSFQRLDPLMPDQLELKPTKYSGLKGEAEPPSEEQFEYTFEKIDKEMQEKWAKEGTVIVGERPKVRKTPIPEDQGPSFAKIDQMKAAEWEKEGIVFTPKPVQPKGFFDEVALPAEPSDVEPTFTKVDQEKGPERAADETLLTEKPKSARAELKALLREGPSYLKAEKEKIKEWDESGLILQPRTPVPKGFFVQPTATTGEELPTFLKIKDQDIVQPKKSKIKGLLKPKESVPSKPLTQESKLPTFLQGQSLTEEQLRQIREFEEEERKRKEKEEKLL
ncbi:MAG: hypothetical protein ACTSRS_15495 [Candidatus Helarchaeota archaeon]